MHLGVPLLLIGLLGQAAAFTHGAGGAPTAADRSAPAAGPEPPPAAGAEPGETSARPRLALVGLLGLGLGLAAAAGRAAAKQPWQTDRDCYFGSNLYKQNPCTYRRGEAMSKKVADVPSPGRLKRPTADTGPAFKYGGDSKYGQGYNMGEQIMNKDGDADGPETRFWARRPAEIAMRGGYFNYMGMANDSPNNKNIRSKGATWTYLTEKDQPDPKTNPLVQKKPIPSWGVKRKP